MHFICCLLLNNLTRILKSKKIEIIKSKNKIYAIFSILTILLVFIMFSIFSGNSTSRWYFEKMNIDKIWTYSKGEGQIIAFIDTGISKKLEKSIKTKIIYKYNVLEDNANVSDLHGHGTEMVSIITGYDKLNILGISPESNLIIIKAVSDEGKTDNNYLLKALKIAEEHNATVVNISLGGFKRDKSVSEQIKKWQITILLLFLLREITAIEIYCFLQLILMSFLLRRVLLLVDILH